MCERGSGVDVPAPSAIGSVGVHDDKAVLVRERLVCGAGVVGLSCSGAVVDGSQEARAGFQCGRNIDVDPDVGGVAPKVGDLYMRSLIRVIGRLGS